MRVLPVLTVAVVVLGACSSDGDPERITRIDGPAQIDDEVTTPQQQDE